ncbi:vesicle-trafficking protein SEC22b-B-like [Pundamilia nyererei]|uniref:Vesicle-trafficking protein SEC22b-B-like n=1 Tax=Pundamilia nyererei TaxID=303518 RepID=A0A9Y3V5D9_9CICH|nr:PREDICTED: vesicle-trafficking protein SEC22b-B-like [Pundamilia nyererei]
MILLTIITRVADGLPLAASVQEDEQSERDLQQYQSQAKQLCRKLDAQSPERCTLDTGDKNFHFLISQGVCYIILCEASFPKTMAFEYLEDLSKEFYVQYGKKVPTVSRPYSFIEFDTYIQKVNKPSVSIKLRKTLASTKKELEDIQKIMAENIAEVMQRDPLCDIAKKVSNLSSFSKSCRSNAKDVNTSPGYAKAVAVAVFITLIIYMRFWWL